MKRMHIRQNLRTSCANAGLLRSLLSGLSAACERASGIVKGNVMSIPKSFNPKTYHPKFCGDCPLYGGSDESRKGRAHGSGPCRYLGGRRVHRSDYCHAPKEQEKHRAAVEAYVPYEEKRKARI